MHQYTLHLKKNVYILIKKKKNTNLVLVFSKKEKDELIKVKLEEN